MSLSERSLADLLQLVGKVRSQLELEKTVRAVMDAVCEALKAKASSVLLVEEDQRGLYFMAATGEKEGEVKKIRMKMGEGIAGWVAAHKEPLIVNNPEADARFSREAAQQIGFMPTAILCYPLVNQGRCIGVVEVLSPVDREGFSDDDLSFLQTASQHMAQALAHSLNYERVQTKARYYQEIAGLEHHLVGRSEFACELRRRLIELAESARPLLFYGPSGTGKTMAVRMIHDMGGPRGPLETVTAEHLGVKSDYLLRALTLGPGMLLVTGSENLSRQNREAVLQLYERDDARRRMVLETTLPLQEIAARFEQPFLDLLMPGAVEFIPLSQRREDIGDLCRYFLAEAARESKRPRQISWAVAKLLYQSDYAQNVRTLKEVLFKAYRAAETETIYLDDLPGTFRRSLRLGELLPLEAVLRDYCARVFALSGGDLDTTAKVLQTPAEEVALLLQGEPARRDR